MQPLGRLVGTRILHRARMRHRTGCARRRQYTTTAIVMPTCAGSNNHFTVAGRVVMMFSVDPFNTTNKTKNNAAPCHTIARRASTSLPARPARTASASPVAMTPINNAVEGRSRTTVPHPRTRSSSATVGLVLTITDHTAANAIPMGTPTRVSNDQRTSLCLPTVSMALIVETPDRSTPSTNVTLPARIGVQLGLPVWCSVDEEPATDLTLGSVDRFVTRCQVHPIPTAGRLAADQEITHREIVRVREVRRER